MDELVVETRGPIRLVTLNGPDALNATNEALHGELARVWRRLDAAPDIRAIVLTGSGPRPRPARSDRGRCPRAASSSSTA